MLLTIKINDDIADGTRLLHQLVQVLLHFTLIFIGLYAHNLRFKFIKYDERQEAECLLILS